MYCNTLVCIAEEQVRRKSLYCRLVRLGEGWLNHNTIECIVG